MLIFRGVGTEESIDKRFVSIDSAWWIRLQTWLFLKKNTPIPNIPTSQQNSGLWNHTFSNHKPEQQKNWFSDRSPRPDFLQQKSACPFWWHDSFSSERVRQRFSSVFSVGSRSHRHGLLEEVAPAPPKMSANYGWWPYENPLVSHLGRRRHLSKPLFSWGRGVLLIHVFSLKNTTWAVAQFEGLAFVFFCVKKNHPLRRLNEVIFLKFAAFSKTFSPTGFFWKIARKDPPFIFQDCIYLKGLVISSD